DLIHVLRSLHREVAVTNPKQIPPELCIPRKMHPEPVMILVVDHLLFLGQLSGKLPPMFRIERDRVYFCLRRVHAEKVGTCELVSLPQVNELLQLLIPLPDLQSREYGWQFVNETPTVSVNKGQRAHIFPLLKRGLNPTQEIGKLGLLFSLV